MSKNDNVIRQWTGTETKLHVAHWFLDEGEWFWHWSAGIFIGDIFCLNDQDHPPVFVKTSSLEGLV